MITTSVTIDNEMPKDLGELMAREGHEKFSPYFRHILRLAIDGYSAQVTDKSVPFLEWLRRVTLPEPAPLEITETGMESLAGMKQMKKVMEAMGNPLKEIVHDAVREALDDANPASRYVTPEIAESVTRNAKKRIAEEKAGKKKKVG